MDTVKVSLAAENVAIQPPEPSSSGELQPVTALCAGYWGRSCRPKFAFCDASGFWCHAFFDSFDLIKYRYALVCSSFVFVSFSAPVPLICPRPALQLLWARCFLLHRSMLIPPSSCPTLSLILCQFYFNLLFWTLGFPLFPQKLSVRLFQGIWSI